MNKLNIKRVIYIIAFLALMSFSCYWTAESLYLWQPSLTRVGGWLIAIVFYIVASICFSKVLSALNKNEYFGNSIGGRGGQLALGLIGLLLFWIGLSLPTNTHTLLYKASIKDVATHDVQVTKGYLEALKDENVRARKLQNAFDEKKLKVNGLLNRFLEQMTDEANSGIGKKCQNIFMELNNVLDNRMEEKKVTSQSIAEWQRVYKDYMKQAHNILERDRKDMNEQIKKIHKQVNSKELAQDIKRCDACLKDIDKMNGIDEDIMKGIRKDLSLCYAFIKKNSDDITFKGKDKKKYASESLTTDTEAMLSVPHVWKDYLTTDKFNGRGFIWWVLIALLVDLAAFIFFNIAQRSKNNAL